MILAGPPVPNPSEILGDSAFGNLLKAARNSYDYVIVDTPPLGAIIDAAVVGQNCDGAVPVVESGAVSFRAAQRTKGQLEAAGCKVLGAVLNKVSGSGQGKYGYGKYGYGYAYEDEDSEE